MGVFGEIFSWLTDPVNWSGSRGIPIRTYEHLQMSVQSVALGALIALPIGLFIGHTRRLEFLAVSTGNLGRALPSFGIVALTYSFTLSWPGNIGFWPTFIALVLLAIPPVLTNTFVGIKGIDRDTLEAARGMGMNERDVIIGLELPLASPLIVAGLRTAAVQVVATATLGAFTGWGGLGRFIVDGFAVRDFGQIGGGAIVVALVAIFTEVGLGGLERLVTPKLSTAPKRGLLRGRATPRLRSAA